MPASCSALPPGAHVATPEQLADQLGPQDIHVWALEHDPALRRMPLLQLLAAYLRRDVDTIRLDDDDHGKPVLANAGALDFNWSHSGGTALIAVARRLPQLGIDIECRPRQRLPVLELARRFFHADECEDLRLLPESARLPAFRKLWCRKEAVLKAQGQGIAYGLDKIVFRLRDGDWHAGHFHGPVAPVDQWHLRGWPVPNGHACLAWCPDERHVRTFHWRHGPHPD